MSVYNVQSYGDGTFIVFQFVDHIYYYGTTKISHEKVMIYDGILFLSNKLFNFHTRALARG